MFPRTGECDGCLEEGGRSDEQRRGGVDKLGEQLESLSRQGSPRRESLELLRRSFLQSVQSSVSSVEDGPTRKWAVPHLLPDYCRARRPGNSDSGATACHGVPSGMPPGCVVFCRELEMETVGFSERVCATVKTVLCSAHSRRNSAKGWSLEFDRDARHVPDTFQFRCYQECLAVELDGHTKRANLKRAWTNKRGPIAHLALAGGRRR